MQLNSTLNITDMYRESDEVEDNRLYPFIHGKDVDLDTLSEIDANISAPETRIVYTENVAAKQSPNPIHRNRVRKDWDYSMKHAKSFDDFKCNLHSYKTNDKLIYYKQQWTTRSHNKAFQSTRPSTARMNYSLDDQSKPYTYQEMLNVLDWCSPISG